MSPRGGGEPSSLGGGWTWGGDGARKGKGGAAKWRSANWHRWLQTERPTNGVMPTHPHPHPGLCRATPSSEQQEALFPHILDLSTTLPVIKTTPSSEQQEALCPSNFGISALPSQGGGVCVWCLRPCTRRRLVSLYVRGVAACVCGHLPGLASVLCAEREEAGEAPAFCSPTVCPVLPADALLASATPMDSVSLCPMSRDTPVFEVYIFLLPHHHPPARPMAGFSAQWRSRGQKGGGWGVLGGPGGGVHVCVANFTQV